MATRKIEHTLGDNLARSREDAGISPAEMALRMGTTKSTIQRWERDAAAPPLLALERWAELVGVDYDELAGPQVRRLTVDRRRRAGDMLPTSAPTKKRLAGAAKRGPGQGRRPSAWTTGALFTFGPQPDNQAAAA